MGAIGWYNEGILKSSRIKEDFENVIGKMKRQSRVGHYPAEEFKVIKNQVNTI